MALHPRDAALLLAGRAVRTFCLGALSLALPLALKARGVGPSGLGALLTATLVEDAVVTVAVTALAPRWGRRRLLILSALPMVLGGVVLLLPGLPMGILALAVVLAVVSPSGQEAGPFSPLEQAALPDAVPPSRQTRAFAWYNVAGFLPAATGVLAAGSWIRLAGATGMGPEEALRTVFGVYAAGGAVLAVLYAGLSRPAAGTGVATSAASLRHLGLSGSRSIVFQLALLQGLDSLAGGFVVQSLLVWWFDLRFGVGPEVLGPLFFGTQALSALSFLAAPRVVDRIGLLNTMVFTHLLSNVLLAGVAFMPTFPLAVAALLARHLFSQMDVPTRQSYTMALVAPEERAPAAGLLTAARGLAQAVSPVLTGVALARAALGVPFLLAGGLKIVYDLVLYFRLRRVPLRAAVDRTAER